MVNSTEFPPIPPDIAAVTAPLLLGTLFNWALYGILTVQTYIYYLSFPDDVLWQKILIYGCYIIEVVQTAMTAADVYFWLVTGYGNVAHLGNVNISPIDTPIFCGIIALFVQCFFAYRIYTLRPSYRVICALIVMTSILQFAGAIGAGIRALILQQFSRFHEHREFPQAIYVWLVSDVVCDLLIAGAMFWLFYESKNDGIEYGRLILSKLVRLIVETNLLTSGFAMLSFIFYVVIPSDNAFICTTLVMGKLYSNTLLVTFNNRIAMRNIATEHTFGTRRRTGSIDNTGKSERRMTDSENTTFRVVPRAVVSIDTTVESESFHIETVQSSPDRRLSDKL